MKFVVWGLGFRGKVIIDILTPDKIEFIIDNDKYTTIKEFQGIKVISLEQYLNLYRNIEEYIILSMAEYEEPEKILVDNGVFSYFILSECPSEFVGYGIRNLDVILASKSLKEGDVIVGSNLYSILLYMYAKTNNINDVTILPTEERKNNEIINLLKEDFGVDIVDVNVLSIPSKRIVITTRNYLLDLNQYNVVNFFDLYCDIKEYFSPDLVEFKNKHCGEKRCFIVATGPSLTVEDIEVLRRNKEITFSVNRIFNLKNTDWVPDYYVATDRCVINQYKKEMLEYGSKNKIINMHALNGDEEGIIPIHVMVGDLLDRIPNFSEKIEYGIFGGATVVFACIQLAIYMGFKNIYLLGVDCNYVNNSKNNYFFEDNKTDKAFHHEDKMILSYVAAANYARNHGIKIYNASRGGKLDVFERINFDLLFD